MAVFQITIPDNMAPKLIAAFASAYHYEAMIPDPAVLEGELIPNPESKTAFAKRMVKKYIHEVYIAAKSGADIDDLRKAAIDAAKVEIAPVEVS